MGFSYSKNIVDADIKSIINVMNSASQTCKSNISQTQFQNFNNINNSRININQNWDQIIQFNYDCLQNVSFQNDTSQKVSQEAKQIAESISEFLALGAADAENVARLNQDLAIQVSNAFSQTCAVDISQTQGQVFNNIQGSDITIFQNWNQYNNSMINCVMQDSAVSNTSQEMQQVIDQSATAKALGLGSLISGFIIIIIAVIALLIFGYMLIKNSGFRRSYTNQPQPQQQPYIYNNRDDIRSRNTRDNNRNRNRIQNYDYDDDY
jgi:hypothetical protein